MSQNKDFLTVKLKQNMYMFYVDPVIDIEQDLMQTYAYLASQLNKSGTK